MENIEFWIVWIVIVGIFLFIAKRISKKDNPSWLLNAFITASAISISIPLIADDREVVTLVTMVSVSFVTALVVSYFLGRADKKEES